MGSELEFELEINIEPSRSTNARTVNTGLTMQRRGNMEPTQDMALAPSISQTLGLNSDQLQQIHAAMFQHSRTNYEGRPLEELSYEQLQQVLARVEQLLENSPANQVINDIVAGISLNAREEEEDIAHQEERINRINEALMRNPNFEYQGRAVDDLSTPELDELLGRIEQYERGLKAPTAKYSTNSNYDDDYDVFEPLSVSARTAPNTQQALTPSSIYEPIQFAQLDTSFSLPSGLSPVSNTEYASYFPEANENLWNDISTPTAVRPSPFVELIGKLASKLLEMIGLKRRAPTVKELARRVKNSHQKNSRNHDKNSNLAKALERARKNR